MTALTCYYSFVDYNLNLVNYLVLCDALVAWVLTDKLKEKRPQIVRRSQIITYYPKLNGR